MVTIRSACEGDLVRINDIYNQAVPTTATADYVAWEIEQRQQWFAERAAKNMPVFVAEIDGEVVGWASLSPYHHRPGYRFSVENSIYVDTRVHGKGVGRKLVEETIRAARQLDLKCIVASIDATNLACIKLHESLGFVQCAYYPSLYTKFGKWLDVVHMQLILKED